MRLPKNLNLEKTQLQEIKLREIQQPLEIYP